MKQPSGYTREDLIALCESAIRPETVWVNRDSEAATRQLGEAWALLKAGCDFRIADDPELQGNDKNSFWVNIASKGFQFFEYGKGHERLDNFYLPTPDHLKAVGDKDWY